MLRNDIPVYVQVRDQLWQWIQEQQLDSQARLPAERELASRFNTTRVTVRQALGQLEAEGIIFRSNRRGWYITPQRLIYDPSLDIGFYNTVTEQGFTPSTETLSKRLIEAPSWLADISGMAEGAPIYHILRRRSVDLRCVVVEHNYINPRGCPGLLDQDTDLSIWLLLREQYDLVPGKRNIEIFPQALTGVEAEALGVNSGSAGLYMQRLTLDKSGAFLEYDREYWIHDALKVAVQVNNN
ncbi:UTRA domain-containing protein [Neptunomonas japonica]|uniref:UTRA domain-containing protein n=1 Tax=Neptunomonas japonica TaxID=417574 RepID=UPI0004001A89|nr:UTRA domain-containing protein [Neptunomonas japonica]